MQAGHEQGRPDCQGVASNMEIATFGAGCFWGVEAALGNVPGVASTCVGYAGGEVPDPTYEDVCTGRTGHTEVVRVEFDSRSVCYQTLLESFWTCHDPTQVNRQGPDIGYQYRSVIFCESSEQVEAAEASKRRLEESGRFKRPVATAIERSRSFYPAEEYHQQYLAKRGMAACHI